LTIKFTQSTSAASGRIADSLHQACARLRLPTINCQRISWPMRLLIAGLPFAFRLPPQQTTKDTHKNLTLAFVVISIYSVVKYRPGFFNKASPPQQLWIAHGFRFYPCDSHST